MSNIARRVDDLVPRRRERPELPDNVRPLQTHTATCWWCASKAAGLVAIVRRDDRSDRRVVEMCAGCITRPIRTWRLAYDFADALPEPTPGRNAAGNDPRSRHKPDARPADGPHAPATGAPRTPHNPLTPTR